MNRSMIRTMAYHALVLAAAVGLSACSGEGSGENQTLADLRKTQQKILDEIKSVKVTMKSMERRGLTINMEDKGAKGSRPIDVSGSPRLGPENAPVVVVEYADFECPFCRRAAGFAKNLVETHQGQVAFVFKHFPLRRHENARYAAQASWAAGRQGKFWEFHDALFAAPGIDQEQVRAVAEAIGLDMARFDADVASPASLLAVQKDRREGKDKGIRGTPAFFVNGEQVRADAGTIRARVAQALGARGGPDSGEAPAAAKRQPPRPAEAAAPPA